MIGTDLTLFILIGLIVMVASTIQSATGFGFALVCMSLLPLLIPFRTAAIIEIITVFFINLFISLKLRKFIRFRLLLWPFLGNLLFIPAGVYVLMISSEIFLRRMVGIALLILMAFFVFLSDRVRMRATPLSGFVAGSVSGFIGGMIGIGGPVMAIYFLSVTDDKKVYNATIQSYFLIGSVYTFVLHLVAGNVTGDALRYGAVALSGLCIGTAVGFAIFKKLSTTALKKIIYVFMVLIGLYLLISG